MEFTDAMRSYPPGCYENYIHKHFIGNLGFDLSPIGEKTISNEITVNLEKDDLIALDEMRNSFADVTEFLKNPSTTRYDSMVWYKINLIDQVINDYTGVGSFNLQNDYLKFIQHYLSVERADQSGDTLIAFFDKDFNWAFEFKLSQDNRTLSATVFDSKSRAIKTIDHIK
jgi:hypothetical protein